MVKYSTISLPKELYDVLQNLIEKNPEWGYNSVADFCKEAIRIHLYEIKKELREDFWRKLDVKDLLRKIEIASECSKSDYQVAFRYIKDMAVLLSKDFKIRDVNNAFVSMLGYERKNIFNKPMESYIDNWKEIEKELKEEGYIRDFETKIKRRDGKKIDVLVTINKLRDEYFGVIKDITIEKYVRDKNKKLKELYEYIINNLYNTVVVIQNGKIKFVNRSPTLTGYNPEEVINKKVEEFVIEEDRERLRRNMERKLRGKDEGKPSYYRLLSKKGDIIKVEAISRRIEFEGKPALLTCVKRIEDE